MSKFHNYSFNNTLLITMQKPEATLVAGYQAWQKKFNRHVKRGEKGIQIIAPAPIREKQEIEKIDLVTKEPVIGDDGQPETNCTLPVSSGTSSSAIGSPSVWLTSNTVVTRNLGMTISTISVSG